MFGVDPLGVVLKGVSAGLLAVGGRLTVSLPQRINDVGDIGAELPRANRGVGLRAADQPPRPDQLGLGAEVAGNHRHPASLRLDDGDSETLSRRGAEQHIHAAVDFRHCLGWKRVVDHPVLVGEDHRGEVKPDVPNEVGDVDALEDPRCLGVDVEAGLRMLGVEQLEGLDRFRKALPRRVALVRGDHADQEGVRRHPR